MPFLKRLYQYRLLLVLWLGVIVVGFLGAVLQFWHTLAMTPVLPLSIQEPVSTPIPPTYALATDSAQPKLTAHAVWVYDRNAQQVLLAEHAEVATAPASLVKMMTALVVFDNLDLDDTVTIGSASAVPGNRAKFLSQDQFSVRDLFKTMLLFSANDAAEALAQATSAPTSFIDQMNAKAQQLSLRSTHFTNVTGLDDPDQVSSAQDLGHLADQLLQNPFLEETVSQQIATVKELRTGRLDTVYTTNNLLQRGPQFLGVKTGTTDQAGQNLIFRYRDTWPIPLGDEGEQSADPESGTARDLDLIVVILGSQDRYQDALALLPWLQHSLRLAENSVR